VWFLCVLAGSLAMVFFIPPFQTNDEVAHWYRAWTVADTGVLCRGVPRVATTLQSTVETTNLSRHQVTWSRALLHAAAELPGDAHTTHSGFNACFYSPVAYVLPALALRLVARPFDPSRPSRILAAFYAARITNWLLMGVGVLLFLLYAPRARNLTLVMYALPMTIQQTIAINQDSLIFVAALLLLWAWWAAPSWTGLLVALGLLLLVKIIYACLLLWVLCALWRLPPARRWRSALLLAIPLGLCLLWNGLVVRRTAGGYVPPGVNPHEQLQYLAAHPLRFFALYAHQLRDYFGRGHMNGGWTGILGVLGWAQADLANRAYAALALAIVAAFALDLAGDETTPPVRSWRVERVGPIVSALAIVPAVSLVMYLVFTPPGWPYILGVQGRYLELPLFFALFLVGDWLRALPRWRDGRARAWLSPRASRLAWAPFALCVVGYVEMARTIWTLYGFGS
jgi:uncharacterized membrane protein